MPELTPGTRPALNCANRFVLVVEINDRQRGATEELLKDAKVTLGVDRSLLFGKVISAEVDPTCLPGPRD